MNDQNCSKSAKRNLMITKKNHTLPIISIFIISSCSLIYGSENKKSGMLNGIKFTRNQESSPIPPKPACMESNASTELHTKINPNTPAPELTDKQKAEADKITAYLAERNVQTTEFDELTDFTPALTTTEILPTPSNKLGDPYPQAILPEQEPKIPLSGQGWTESDIAYILRLIKDGQFKQALSSNDQILELLGQALKSSVIAFSEKQESQQKQTLTTLEQQRPDFKKTTEDIDLIRRASLTPSRSCSIIPVRIEEMLTILEKTERKLEEETNLTLKELINREKRIKELRNDIRNLHATADKLRPISPERKITFQQPK